MRIVSLVPSLTETLIECDVNVVGRTRYCIHPAASVASIKVVGGTKSLNINDILNLQPNYVILDKEENKKEMADELLKHDIKIIVSHIEKVADIVVFLKQLASDFKNEQLLKIALRYEIILDNLALLSPELFFKNSVLTQNSPVDLLSLSYVIWKNPFMVIGPNTFISDIFKLFNLNLPSHEQTTEKYPQISEDKLKTNYCLFSSEPFPFEKHFDELDKSGFKFAIVDGEKISWYGIRNLIFLESCLK